LATDPACVDRLPRIDTAAVLDPIYFSKDNSGIGGDAAATLDKKPAWLQVNPGMRVRIEGNADEPGSDEYNLAIAQRRALAAKTYLVNHRIAGDRFDVVSYGRERRVCSDPQESCRAQNRRVDFRIITLGGNNLVRPTD
jgi:peptidoglycan-associated lipoprotein